MGTKESEFIELNEKTGEANALTCGHGEGELWGLATHPSSNKFITASEDGTVRLWDVVNKVGGIKRSVFALFLLHVIYLFTHVIVSYREC